VQTWLDSAIGAGAQGSEPGKDGMPMEVAIVGDIAVDRAIRLAEKYIASLPGRPRMTPDTFAERRIAARAERPPEVLALDHWEGEPLVLVGFFGTDIREIADHRALTVAARILSSRLDRLPPEHNERDEAFALSMPSSVYPGFGLFLAATHAKEGNEAGASENIRKLLDDLLENGPSEDELKSATAEVGDSAERLLSDPVYWARALSRSMYHGFRVSEIGRAEDVYRGMPGAAIVSSLRKYCTPERSIRLIVQPGASEGEEKDPRVRDE
jgi:predicted Zn-dependent peptidase